MGTSAVSRPFLALLCACLCTPVLSDVHTLYTSNFHNGSELYTLQFDDENLEINEVSSTPADGPMVWLDFDVSTSYTSLKHLWEKELNPELVYSIQEPSYTVSHSKPPISPAIIF